MKDNRLPRLSIIVPTLNNSGEIAFFLQSITNQDYPKDNIEILICDGGSTDNTREIACKYEVKIIENKMVLADAGVNTGMTCASGDLLMVLAVDNIYLDKKSFIKIANTFFDKSIIAAFPKQVSDYNDSLFTKYTNTFTDPYNHFVYGNAANARTFHKVYNTIEKNDLYDIYDYKSSRTKPLLALAQGFTIRRGVKRSEKDTYDDISPVMSIIDSNYQIAYIHSLELYHHTTRDIWHFIRKTRWATLNAISNKKYGISQRRSSLSSFQKFKIVIWPLYGASFVLPFIYSVYKLIREREILWLFHPVICLISVYSSVTTIIFSKTITNFEISRK